MVSSIAEAKTGSSFEWIQSLTNPIDVAARYQTGLIGLTAVAQIIDARGVRLHQFPMQNISVGQKEVTFVCPAEVTLGWVVGEYVRMDILFSNGLSSGQLLTQTINILVLLGITRPQTTGIGTGGFGPGFGDGLNKGASGT